MCGECNAESHSGAWGGGSAGIIYRTNSWKSGKNTFYHEYVDDGGVVKKIKVGLYKWFDGRENVRERDERVISSWSRDDPEMPEWLRGLLG